MLVLKTLNTFTGKKEPVGNAVKTTSSPPTVNTLKFPPAPMYKVHPLFPLPF